MRLAQWCVVLVKLGFGIVVWQAIEIGEQVRGEPRLVDRLACLDLLRLSLQVIYQYLGMNFFLNVKWRRVNN